MTLNTTALVTLVQAKAHLRIDAATSLRVDAEYVGIGDGADKTFSLDNTPIGGSLQLYVNNALQVETTNFSISGGDLTFVTAPTDGYPITASYDMVASDNTFESYDDDELETLIEAATLEAERYTSRAFIIRTVTEEHFGIGSQIMTLYRRPVVSITSVVRRISEAVATGDGSTLVFTLNETPTDDASVSLYKDGTLQVITTDYTLSGATITFVAAPGDTVKVTAKYTHTILAINEFTERLHQARLAAIDRWTANRIYQVVYEAGYAATRAATQALIPDVVSAVLLILAGLYENRIDRVVSESVVGVGSATYRISGEAQKLLDLSRVRLF